MKFDFSDGEWKGLHGNGVNKNGNIEIWANSKKICTLKKCKEDVSNARLISCAPEMVKALISYRQTYEVLKDIFKEHNIWGHINGAFIGTYDSDKLIEKALNKKWSEINV